MTAWRAQFRMAALICAASAIHDHATAGLPNTPAAMLLYHGTAALLDLGLLFFAHSILAGRVCAVSQWLLFASIVCNFLGWLLYLSYAPPLVYDLCIAVLTAAQLLTLFTPNRRDATHPRDALVRHRARLRGGNHP